MQPRVDTLIIKEIPINWERLEALIQEMLDQGIVEESSSPWASPIVLVAKSSGNTQFCVDY